MLMYLNYHKMFAYVLLVYDLPTNLKDLLVGEFYVKDGKNFVKLDDEKLNIIVEKIDNLIY